MPPKCGFVGVLYAAPPSCSASGNQVRRAGVLRRLCRRRGVANTTVYEGTEPARGECLLLAALLRCAPLCLTLF